MSFNKFHVKYEAVIGGDGMKKNLINSIFALSAQSNMNCVGTKKDAIARLLKHEYYLSLFTFFRNLHIKVSTIVLTDSISSCVIFSKCTPQDTHTVALI